ncbi:MAG: hypothetical protein M0P99_06130 [Candidatus Cloacimonetes bacterium]|nr:hypothetical protein [Candidatus Cloacimonadota bacterium]
MKIEKIKISGYIGIYNGLRLYELSIDFTKASHKIILIKGGNGSGKSTLMTALSPLPDDNSSFIPGQQAEKEIIIRDSFILYKINFIHPVKHNGDRDTTRAYIKKYIGNDVIELNSNGNITSFKDILYSEFNLDPNFIALSQLSVNDRGLADKTPGERKRFAASIIETLEVYNAIYKTLSKRSSIFKSMVNNLSSKIDNIGDENKVKLTLDSLENRINGLSNTRNQLIEQMASYKSMISILDPNGLIQNLYEEIYNKLLILDGGREENNIKIKNCINKIERFNDLSKDTVMGYYLEVKGLIDSLSVAIQVQESKINGLLSDRENDTKILRGKIEKLNSLKSENNYINIETEINNCQLLIRNYEEIFKNANIKNALSISKDEYITGLNILKDIKEVIDIFKSNVYMDVLNDAISYIQMDSIPDIITIQNQINSIKEILSNDTIELKYYETLYDKASYLSLRPTNCKIENCGFISDALDAAKLNPEQKIQSISNKIKENSEKLNILKLTETQIMNILEVINNIRIIFRYIDNYHIILDKLPNGTIFTDKKTLLTRIKNHDTFEDINDLYKFIEFSNIFDEYKIEKQKLKELEADYKLYESKNSIIEDVLYNINELNQGLNNITSLIEENNLILQENKIVLLNAKETLIELDLLITLYNEQFEIEKNRNELTSQFNNIRSNIIQIKENLNNINTINGSIEQINIEMKPLMEDRDTIKHSLTLLKEYVIELQDYKNRYDKVETIKYYSSPTTGIQTLFMDLYMDKIISLANELLSLLFDGEFILGKFIINDKEFKIPCYGSGLANDDISSMSTSEVCMISMILSFALLIQASTKYNVLKLDEIDGGLSTTNRLQFLDVLDRQINMLDIEQCFMISHNSEIDFSNVDLILLKMDESEAINIGNVIYEY